MKQMMKAQPFFFVGTFSTQKLPLYCVVTLFGYHPRVVSRTCFIKEGQASKQDVSEIVIRKPSNCEKINLYGGDPLRHATTKALI